MKKQIIAIFGKSASGKTTTAYWLEKILIKYGYNVRICIEDTTRPKRNSENGTEYNFVNGIDYTNKIRDGRYLYRSDFRGWYYGFDKRQLEMAEINIIIANPTNYNNIMKLSDTYDIYTFYIDVGTKSRIKRSLDRDGFNLEMLRRLISDGIDFHKLIKKLSNDNEVITKIDKSTSLSNAKEIFNIFDYCYNKEG